MYRGLPCIYSSAILSSASLLSGGNLALLRVLAMSMIIFMIRQTFYPHDRVLESQAWKKAVYAGGKNLVLPRCFNMWHLQDEHTQDSGMSWERVPIRDDPRSFNQLCTQNS